VAAELTQQCGGTITYSAFALRFRKVKPFKIKAIKTYVSYVTTFVILRIMRVQRNKKMASSQELYNIRLKTSLFEAKLCYNNFKKLFLLRRPRNLEARRINCTAKEAKATGTQFLK